MPLKDKGYLVSHYRTEIETDQQGAISLIRWRVSQIDINNSQIQRILRDGFQSEEEAIAYANQLYAKNKIRQE